MDQQIHSQESDTPAPVASTNADEQRSTLAEAAPLDGSIGYRIGALIAMVLLAIAAFCLWLYFR
ncbi:MAG: hypothetical protein AABM67_21245 [Acidobacteriota bacterium]